MNRFATVLGLAGDAAIADGFTTLINTPDSFSDQAAARIDEFASQLIGLGDNMQIQVGVLNAMLAHVDRIPGAVQTMGNHVNSSITTFRVRACMTCV